ncbi:MAG: M4 family metallopeptidase [Rhabdochlamydiaceae bacterium]|jgi:Zn-dependent metalloprotease
MPPFFVHCVEDNAFYHSSIQNGECFIFNDNYINCPEVVCHEFTHGVIANTNPLGSSGQEGALNEAIADVVGIVFKRSRYMINDWKIDRLRDLSESFHFKDLKNFKLQYNSNGESTNDHGNVHHNSRFISHAFYLASRNLAASNADQGDKQLLNIWWNAVLSLKQHEKTFNGFIKKTIRIGATNGKIIKEAIEQAWQQVTKQ